MDFRRRHRAFERLEGRSLLTGIISQVDMFETWDAGIIPSTDVAGITYHAGQLYLADSEIDETPQFQGQNVFATNTAGDQLLAEIDVGNDEPTGITYNSFDGFFYVTDDDSERIYRYDTSFSAPLAEIDPALDVPGAGDVEGITSDPTTGMLYVADGIGGTQRILVYDVNLAFQYSFYVGDRVSDPEGIAFHPTLNHVFIISSPEEAISEYLVNGTFVEEYDLSSLSPTPLAPQGLTFAPTSDPLDDPDALSLYIADPGFDNVPDGRIYEAFVDDGTVGNQAPQVDAGPDQSIALPVDAVLDGSVTDDHLPDPPAAVSTTWTQVGGPGGVTFGDPLAVDSTATFPTVGTYVLRLTADDGEFVTSDELTITVVPPGSLDVFEARVAASSDDAEEKQNGSMSLTSADLDLTLSGSDQLAVGMRFTGVAVPQGATIANAYIQFQADEVSSDAAVLTIHGEAIDDAPTFASVVDDIFNRSRTSSSVPWTPASWSAVGDAGPDQRTSNIAAVIQEIVDRPGWASGNAVVTIVSGTGKRAAESFDSVPGAAPLLHIEYTLDATSPPVVTTTVSTLSYTENSGAVAIDPGLTLTDANDTHLGSATVTITGGDVGQDVIGFVDQNGITGSFVGSTLTLTGTATVADYQTALRSTTYRNTSDNPSPTTRTVTFSASDGQGTGADFRSIAVTALNDAPTVTTSPSTLCYAVSDGPVAIEPGIVVMDVDDADLVGATVEITGGVITEDVLAFEDQNGITGSFVGATLTLTGTASVADYEAALSSVTYENTNTTDPNTATRTITFTVDDGQATGAATRDIEIVEALVSHTFETTISASSDDAEEKANGDISLTSSDLDLTLSGSDQLTVGLRFTGVEIPQGMTITSAYIQFQADEVTSVATTLNIQGEAIDNAPAFAATNGNISSRTKTNSSVPWLPNPWNAVGDAGPDQRTADIAAIVQEIVDRPGWVSGNALVALVTGSGKRAAESFDSSQYAAPLLHVEYSAPHQPNQAPVVDVGPDATIALPANVSLYGNVTDDGLPNPPADVTTTWSQVSGTPGVVFGDPAAVDTTATFPNSGTYVLRLTADDGEFVTSDDITVVAYPAGSTVTLEQRVSSSSDDAEENPNGAIQLTSNDLDLGEQTIGIRFSELAIPQGATIVNAYVQFQTDKVRTPETSLTIAGEASDNAQTFTLSTNNITSRPKTTAAVDWSVPAWTTIGEAGPTQQTVGIDSIIQEIVDRPGWTSGNSLVTIVTGIGDRDAESYNGNSSAAPLLHVEYTTDDPPPAPIDFRVLADLPYSPEEYAELETDLANVGATDEFFTHLGDIKPGAAPCDESVYSSVSGSLQTSSIPVFIVPGDNEWNDCADPSQAWNYWDSHLMGLEDNWSHSFNVARQTVREENFSFVHSGTLFIGINLPDADIDNPSEWAQRMTDNSNWVSQNFNNFGDQVTSAVVFAHAFTDENNQQFGDAFVAAAQSFGKPILYAMGNNHFWILDNPYVDAPNVTRVSLDRSVPSLRVTVTHDPNDPFLFDRTPY